MASEVLLRSQHSHGVLIPSETFLRDFPQVVSPEQPFSNHPSPNRACTFPMHTALQLPAAVVSSAMLHSHTLALELLYCLFPFPLYRALPRSFEYYGNSVAMRISRLVGDPAFTFDETFSTYRCLVRSLARSLPDTHHRERFASDHSTGVCVVSPLQVCCDGCCLSPLETRVQPMQASPCVQDLRRVTLHTFALSRVADMLLSPWSFDARLVSCPRRSIALNLLLLWSYLTNAETAHMIG